MQRRADDHDLLTFTTRNCCAYAHPEIVIRCDRATSPEAPHLITWIENMVAAGRTFRAGKTVQIGCCVAAVRHGDEGTLMLYEPNFEGMPLSFVPSLSYTLLAIRKQKNVLDSFGIEQDRGKFPSIWDTVLACRNFNAASGAMMCRTAGAHGNDWFFGCLDETHDHSHEANLVHESLYNLMCQFPQIVDFLALPAGCMIAIDEQGQLLSAVDGDDHEMTVRPGSYLDVKANLQGAPGEGAGAGAPSSR